MSRKVLVIDHGLYTAFAERLGRMFEVFYFAPYADRSFPKPGPAMVGSGLKGVERVEDIWRILPEVDLVVFPDVGFYQLACYLRDCGYKVWSAGQGEKLEVQRWRAKETMKALGLPVGKSSLVTGMSDLRKYLADNEDVYVKISGFRGLAETFHSKTLGIAEPRLAELEDALGGLASVFSFVVEHKIDAVVEAGYDGFCIDGEFPSTCLAGVEVKDRGYLGCVRDYSKLADPVKEINERLAPFLKEAEYRQFFSTEVRVTDNGTPYLIDLTTRCPAPPSSLYWEMIENVGDIVEGGANGDIVEPEWNSKYGAIAIIKSPFAEERWTPVSVDPKVEQWIKWRNACNIEGQTYIIPTEGVRMTEIGDCIGIGDTIEEAIENCKKHAEEVEGFDIKIHVEALPEALKEIENGEKNGITFTDDKLPSLTELMK